MSAARQRPHFFWLWFQYTMISAAVGAVSSALGVGALSGDVRIAGMLFVFVGVTSAVLAVVPGFSLWALREVFVSKTDAEWDQMTSVPDILIMGAIPPIVVGAPLLWFLVVGSNWPDLRVLFPVSCAVTLVVFFIVGRIT